MEDEEKQEKQASFIGSPFDALRHMDGEREFWRARELSKVLGYNRWENFENVIAKAKVACKYNGRDVELNFREITQMVAVGRGAQRKIINYQLTYYAVLLLLVHSDLKKPEVLSCLAYFALNGLENLPDDTKMRDLELFPASNVALTKEQETIGEIVRAFKHLSMTQQYIVYPYRIDLYFPDYKIAVECDENGHRRYMQEKEKKRQATVENRLGCIFVRYNPDSPFI